MLELKGTQTTDSDQPLKILNVVLGTSCFLTTVLILCFLFDVWVKNITQNSQIFVYVYAIRITNWLYHPVHFPSTSLFSFIIGLIHHGLNNWNHWTTCWRQRWRQNGWHRQATYAKKKHWTFEIDQDGKGNNKIDQSIIQTQRIAPLRNWLHRPRKWLHE